MELEVAKVLAERTARCDWLSLPQAVWERGEALGARSGW